jgi:hypothetical protein
MFIGSKYFKCHLNSGKCDHRHKPVSKLLDENQPFSTSLCSCFIAHQEFTCLQRVLSHPLTGKLFRGTNRKDLIFVSTWRHKNFWLSTGAVWFCNVLLLFVFATETDTGIKGHECSFVSFCWEYDEYRPGIRIP